MTLFGTEGNGDGRIALLMGISTVIGGAATYLIALWLKLRAEKREDVEKSEKTIVQHLEALVARLDEEKGELSKDTETLHDEIRKVLEKLAVCDVRCARLRSHIRYLESVLIRAQLSFERYEEEDGGSASHVPLPPTTKAP